MHTIRILQSDISMDREREGDACEALSHVDGLGFDFSAQGRPDLDGFFRSMGLTSYGNLDLDADGDQTVRDCFFHAMDDVFRAIAPWTNDGEVVMMVDEDIDCIRAYRFRLGRVSAGHGSVRLSWADSV